MSEAKSIKQFKSGRAARRAQHDFCVGKMKDLAANHH
jgi:hypothetical protein